MIPAFNCADTLVETISSVLSQDPGEKIMQIQVVDDASTDTDVGQLVARLGKGRIEYFRQEKNVGSLANFETCIQRSRGRLIHLLHGDDKAKPGFYAKMADLFEQYPQIGAAFCRYAAIDGQGKVLWNHGKEMDREGVLDNWLYKIASHQRLQYCTIAVKREVYEKLGGFYGVTYGEDWEMWVRIAAHYDVGYTPEILAEYRVHPNSISHRAFMTAEHVRDMRWVINSIQKWVPEQHRKKLQRIACTHYAEYAIDVANKIWHQTGNKRVTNRLIRETVKMRLNGHIARKIMKIYAKMLINRR